MTSPAAPANAPNIDWLKSSWPLLVGFAVLAAPTLASVGEQVWSRESGAHGPIVLATGAWLLWRQLAGDKRPSTPGRTIVVLLGVVLSLALYVFGRAFDFISLEVAGLYAVGVTMFYAKCGASVVLRNWFPLFYLGFCVPPPTWLIDQLTGPLKEFASLTATSLLRAFDLPIEREGVTIHIAQYQLLVEDACSGMNSLIGLSAISLFYIFLLRGSSLRYSLLLTLFIVPIAVAGNILRVITLILLTYFFGDAVAQGFAHFAAGIFLFAADLMLVFLVDMMLIKVVPKSWRPA